MHSKSLRCIWKNRRFCCPENRVLLHPFIHHPFHFSKEEAGLSSLWEWNERGRWRDKRLGCCHWEIIDPRTLPICTKNALNNRIKKVRHHGNQKHLARIDHQFSHKGMKSEPFSVQWTARMHKEKGKKVSIFWEVSYAGFQQKKRRVNHVPELLAKMALDTIQFFGTFLLPKNCIETLHQFSAALRLLSSTLFLTSTSTSMLIYSIHCVKTSFYKVKFLNPCEIRIYIIKWMMYKYCLTLMLTSK